MESLFFNVSHWGSFDSWPRPNIWEFRKRVRIQESFPLCCGLGLHKNGSFGMLRGTLYEWPWFWGEESYNKVCDALNSFSSEELWEFLSFTKQESKCQPKSLWKCSQMSFLMSHGGKWMLVCQSCPALCSLLDYSPPGSSVHRILQARMVEWVAMLFSRGSSWPWWRLDQFRIQDLPRSKAVLVYLLISQRAVLWAMPQQWHIRKTSITRNAPRLKQI